jgi:BlaI family penicillinase repressor
MPKKKPSNNTGAKITHAEWEVMQILWNAGTPLSAAEVIARLETKANWNPKTVRTFLNRLVQKRAVRAVKQSRAGYELLHYVPLIDRVTALQAKQATFADRFFGGTIHSMLAGCIQSGEISIDELRELREMIDSKIEEPKS